MFIAMNRFKVLKGSEDDFEQVWLSRETHLEDVPGFVEFHLLKGPERDDHVLYASHSIWRSHDDFEAWTVVLLGQPAFSQGHAHSVANPLPQRAGCRLHAGRDVVFRMARSLAAPLAEPLQFLHGHAFITAQIKQAVNQHGTMSAGENKAIAIGPLNIFGIMF